MPSAPETVAEVLDAGASYLAARDVPEPRLGCEWLCARLLNCRRLDLHPRLGDVLSEKKLEAMRRGVKRLAAGEPVQYVLGEWDFMGRTFRVDRRALIPRPETESLVQAVLQCEPLWTIDRPAIADVGTGSGCIVVSLALERPQGHYLAVDISAEALALARENGTAHGVADRIGFSERELCDLIEPGMLDAIVSNPPYVPTAEYERLPLHIRGFEPRLALDGGARGLDVIEPLVQDAAVALKPGGCLFMEIGSGQRADVESLLRGAGFEQVAVGADAAGHDRILTGVLSREAEIP